MFNLPTELEQEVLAGLPVDENAALRDLGISQFDAPIMAVPTMNGWLAGLH